MSESPAGRRSATVKEQEMIRTAIVSVTAAVVVVGVAGHAAQHRAQAGAARLDYANTNSLVSAGLARSLATTTPSAPNEHKGNHPYIGLAFLTSAATGESVDKMKLDLRQGKSLDTIAGAKDAQIKSEANGYVRILVDFAVAQGLITSAQADADAQQAGKLITYLMAADVSEYITSAGSSIPSTLPAPTSPSGA